MIEHRRQSACLCTRAMVAAALLICAPALQAQDLGKQTSLKWIPADAASYSASLRNREQFEIIFNSKAWAKITALPVVKMLQTKIEDEWNKGFGYLDNVKQWYDQPANRQLVDLLKEMFSEETFFFGGKGSAEALALLGEVYGAYQFGPLAALAQGDVQAAGNPAARAKYILQYLTDNSDRLKLPDLVMGFKIKNTKAVDAQLQRLDTFWQALAQQAPALKNRLKKTKIAGAEFHTLKLDGKLVPWENLPLGNFEERPGQFDNLVKALKSIKLTVSLGVKDQYLLVSMGEGTGGLEALGAGTRLIDREEFKPLAKFAGKRLTSIAYTSKEAQRAVSGGQDDLEGMTAWANELVQQTNLTPAQKTQIRNDLKALARDLARYTPQPGAHLAFSFLTERGSESYAYDWSKNRGFDGSKPLSLLHHVGGAPLAFVCSRSKYSPDDYQLLVKWLKKGHGYFEELVLPLIGAQEAQQYQDVFKLVKPLLVRLDKTTGTKFLPALADGQSAFVLDSKLASKQWHALLPPARQALPMLEPALVLSVSDAALLRQAMQEYRDIANDTIDLVGALMQGGIDFKIPPPQSRKIDAGTLYSYPLPEAFGLDKKILPSAGLSAKVATLAISSEHAGRLLAKTPLFIRGGPLSDLDRPLAAAVYFDWAGLVEVATPWVEYALVETGQDGNQDVAAQVRTVLQILQVLRTYASATYIESGAVVTHGETVFRDLKK